MSAPPTATPPLTYDEALLPSGEWRAHWTAMADVMQTLGSSDLRPRWEYAEQLLEENGVTYTRYGEPGGLDRPWQLNPVPLLLSQDDWGMIERAVAQRATLLNLALGDLYGEQRSLRDGWLPAGLIHRHPGFLRPCHGAPPRGDRHLILYGADLARSPDGGWRVLADRTQAPSGAGYALENRVVLSRALPELFSAYHVRRLAPYFETVRNSLLGLGTHGSDDPQVVVLTPGPLNETYFEHVYLARYLGFPLVEGADLTVRDERVYLKTLSGLRRVDVILRRQDDHFCDPVELYGESHLGVPGLVQAVRARHIVLANALGSGLIETAAIHGFLPRLARELLGQALLMPSVESWWCGDRRAMNHVLSRLPELVIKPTFPGPGGEVVFGGELDAAGRDSLRRRIRDRPADFVAQERVELSTSPTHFGPDPASRHLVVRVFAVATGDGYAVMPGGLTRFSPTPGGLVVSGQSGGGSKDTLVLTDRPVRYVSYLARAEKAVDVSRDSYALTSRVADNLFWLGRMSERLEAGVRVFRMALRGLSTSPTASSDRHLSSEIFELMLRLGRPIRTERDPRPGGSGDESAAELLRSMFDPGPCGLRDDASELHRLAGLVRDRVSSDAWQALLKVDQRLVERPHASAAEVSDALPVLDELVFLLSAFSGLVMDSTTRGLGWRFLDFGRRLERGLQIAALTRAALTSELHRGSRQLHRVLETADCAITYRSRYHTSVQLPLVVDLLLLDEANPRSLAFQMIQIGTHLSALDRVPSDSCFALLAALRATGIRELGEGEGNSASRARIVELLFDAGGVLCDLSDSLNHAYLSHALPTRQPEAAWGESAP